ncbi:MAG TPA: DUF3788 domain-containing protein [Bryobacteraceae bacterium]|nr:DUF3788 domain-containing protein [Bryobacteraceae bacterium]
MSDLAPNAFIGRKDRPTDDDLAGTLGGTKPLWDGLIAEMAEQHGATIQEWKCYSVKAGWALRLIRGKRTILWMAPCEGSFRVSFILGERAVLAARQSGLSARLLKILDEAPKYPEGTGVRLHIKAPRDIPAVRKLAVIKLEN